MAEGSRDLVVCDDLFLPGAEEEVSECPRWQVRYLG
jgi:hypothetical protein